MRSVTCGGEGTTRDKCRSDPVYDSEISSRLTGRVFGCARVCLYVFDVSRRPLLLCALKGLQGGCFSNLREQIIGVVVIVVVVVVVVVVIAVIVLVVVVVVIEKL